MWPPITAEQTHRHWELARAQRRARVGDLPADWPAYVDALVCIFSVLLTDLSEATDDLALGSALGTGSEQLDCLEAYYQSLHLGAQTAARINAARHYLLSHLPQLLQWELECDLLKRRHARILGALER